MPMITAKGKSFEVPAETNLRQALLDHAIDLYSEGAAVFNCHGHGACGTCVVQVEGIVSEPTPAEAKRMTYPPHSAHSERRLACQVKVLGDVRVTKFDGYFGEGEQEVWTPDQESIEVPQTAAV